MTIATGIALEIPHGYAGLVLPRSGLAARHGVTCLNVLGPDPPWLPWRGRGHTCEHRSRQRPTRSTAGTGSPSWRSVEWRRPASWRSRASRQVNVAREVSVIAADEAKSEMQMQRLSGLDSMFFYMETPTNHMHVTGLFLVTRRPRPVASPLNRCAPSWRADFTARLP